MDKPLLLADILAAGDLRPEEAPRCCTTWPTRTDEEIAEAVSEALLTAESLMEDLYDPDYIDPEDDDPTPLFGPHGKGTSTDRCSSGRQDDPGAASRRKAGLRVLQLRR